MIGLVAQVVCTLALAVMLAGIAAFALSSYRASRAHNNREKRIMTEEKSSLESLAEPEHTKLGLGPNDAVPPHCSSCGTRMLPRELSEFGEEPPLVCEDCRARRKPSRGIPAAMFNSWAPDGAQQYAQPRELSVGELELAAIRTTVEVLRRLADSQGQQLRSLHERVAVCEDVLRMLTSALAEDAGTDTALYVLATMRDVKGTKFNAGKRVDCPTVGEVRAATIEVPRDCELLEVAVWESRGHLCSVKVGTEQIGFGQIPAVACPMVVAKGTLVTVQVMRTGE